MNVRTHLSRLASVFAVCVACAAPAAASSPAATPANPNARLVAQAFDNWKQGTGTVFDLLADDMQWTVAGVSPVSGTYRTRESFIADAVRPITSKLDTPIVPTVKHIVAQDDQVVVLWDGVATGKDGQTYENSYAWHMTLDGGRITQVVAFLDTWRLVQLME